MSLQFDPGVYAQIYEQNQNRDAQQRQQNNQNLTESVNSIPQALIGYGQNQKQDQMNKLLMKMKQDEEARKTQETTSKFGNPNAAPMQTDQSSYLPDISSNPLSMGGNFGNAPSQPSTPMFGGGAPPPQGQGEAAMPESPIVAAHKQHLASRNSSPMFKQPQQVPFDQMSFPERLKTYGTEGMDSYTKYQKEINGDKITPYQTAELGIQGQRLQQERSKIDATVGEKSDQFNQKEWDHILKETDPLSASPRTTLGLAVKADFNANRAIQTLSKPMVTNQEAGNVMADIAQIYQGGSPTQYGMSHQGYDTLYGKITGAVQSLTGNPQDSLPAPIKQRLMSVLQEMKATNNAVMKQAFDAKEVSQPKVISHFSNEWKALRQQYERGVSPGTNQVPGGATHRWNPQTGKVEVIQ